MNSAIFSFGAVVFLFFVLLASRVSASGFFPRALPSGFEGWLWSIFDGSGLLPGDLQWCFIIWYLRFGGAVGGFLQFLDGFTSVG